MAASGLFMNYSDVTATPVGGGTAIVIKEITDIDINVSNKTEEWRASGRHYASMIVGTDRSRSITIQTGDLTSVIAIDPDVIYTLSWTLKDARNGAGIGALNHTLVNAVKTDNPRKGQHNKFTKGTITFGSFATLDVDPLTVTVQST